MDESLWREKTCTSLISELPVWIIEHAWTHRMMEVLQVLGPPLWLEGDWSRLNLEDPCSIRVVAAEAWMVVWTRDIKHFERVMEFLDATLTLLPQLVTSIKHMKIMFGLKTLVIMWMLWDDQSPATITDKITKFCPDNLPQYHRSSHKHMELMKKTHRDFRNFAQSLARNPDQRKTYIRDLIEEQYGERYALKVEERLLHYLEKLDKALPQPTCIDQILKQSWPLEENEQLLQQLLTCHSTTLLTTLKRLLRCALATHTSHDKPETCQQVKQAEGDRPDFGPFCVTLRPSQEREEERLSQGCSQSSWLNNRRPSLLQKSSEKICLDGQMNMVKQKPCLRPEKNSDMVDPQNSQTVLPEQRMEVVEVTSKRLCSKHGKKMKTILMECSEEFKTKDSQAPLAHSECTPPSPLAPIGQSTPQRLTRSSASLLQDSSSTNVSLSSYNDSSSTNISGVDVPQVASQQFSGQPVSFTPPGQPANTRTSSVQLNISPKSSSELLLQFPSPVSPVRPSTVQNISPSPRTSSSVRSSSSNRVDQVRSPASLGHQPCTLSSRSTSSATSSQRPTSVQVSYTTKQALDAVAESRSMLRGKLKLSVETQGFFLQCRLLQPQVLLHRLSQQQELTTGQSSEKEEVEEERVENLSFDVNLLYTDSESDAAGSEDSDDSDYVPSKKVKAYCKRGLPVRDH